MHTTTGKIPFLLVRVAGYCAYFNDLSDDLRDNHQQNLLLLD
jgi:pyruvate-formate lyase